MRSDPRHPVVLLAALSLLSGLPLGCSEGSGQRCPSDFSDNDTCPVEGRVCPFPASKCGLNCTCTNVIGALVWQCGSNNSCSCLCSCGWLLTMSCELLDCSHAYDGGYPACPSAISSVCSNYCFDAKIPEAGFTETGVHDARVDSARHDVRPPDARVIDSRRPEFRTDLPRADLPRGKEAAVVDTKPTLPDLKHDSAQIKDAPVVPDAPAKDAPVAPDAPPVE
jgi:hypothetical protein